MEVMVSCCAGLDVHQATVVACLGRTQPNGRCRKEVRTFATTRHDLCQLRDWLIEAGCELAAMESTGVYWMPVYEVLEGHLRVMVANAQHIRNVPGRKTDVKDCEWICDLARHGLIRAGFVPPKAIRDIRDLTRYRRKLEELQAGDRNRLIKVLESAGIKLAGVASDVFGVSGRAMLRAMIEGQDTAEAMAKLARGPLRRKHDALVRALDAPLAEHQRLMLRTQLQRVEQTEADIEAIDSALREMLVPYQAEMGLVMTHPGINWVGAACILGEIGVDMTVFASGPHLASWTGACPGNYQSAGKQRGGGRRKGNVFLLTTLVTAAVVASRRRGTYLAEKYHRLAARRGRKRAGVAMAHKIVIAIWHMLRHGTPYRDLGADYLERIDRKRTTDRMVRRLSSLGYEVQLTEKAA